MLFCIKKKGEDEFLCRLGGGLYSWKSPEDALTHSDSLFTRLAMADLKEFITKNPGLCEDVDIYEFARVRTRARRPTYTLTLIPNTD